jgi:hypothetical protein
MGIFHELHNIGMYSAGIYWVIRESPVFVQRFTVMGVTRLIVQAFPSVARRLMRMDRVLRRITVRVAAITAAKAVTVSAVTTAAGTGLG